jgi:hypothetical protein
MVLSIKPEFSIYVEKDRLIFKVEKALYGLIQSARLWYECIASELKKIGFNKNEADTCVFNGTYKNKQVTVGIYVDDLLVTSESTAAIDFVYNHLKKTFKEVSRNSGEVLSYLGMRITKTPEGLKVDMHKMIEDILKDNNIKSTRKSPAENNLFKNIDATPLSKENKSKFHTNVAKLLYLARKVRPDISLATSYLCGRVTNPTTVDELKLLRILMYLNGTKEKFVEFKKGSNLNIEAYIDAAFASYEDGRSQSGLVIKIGGNTVLSRSVKQSILSRSSTESELAALSDNVKYAVKLNEFLKCQGIDTVPPMVYQDNQPTISLVRNKDAKLRSKYFKVRAESVRELIEDEEIQIQYVATQDMIADMLTKPLQGALLERLCNQVMRYHEGAMK